MLIRWRRLGALSNASVPLPTPPAGPAKTHIEAKHIVNVMARNPELFSDLPAIPADVAIKPGYVFKP